MTPARFLFLLLLPVAGCAAPPADPGETWKSRIRDLRLDWNRVQLEEFLQKVRAKGLHLPHQDGGGGYQIARAPMVYFDRYPLDDAFDLLVVWKDETYDGLQTAVVVGLHELRQRIPPEFFDAVMRIHRCPSAREVWDFDAVRILRTVNFLQRLGDGARMALKAYYDLCRSSTADEQRRYGLNEFRILPLVQLLYERRSGMPPFPLGDGGLAAPGSTTWPLFPMALVKDHPFIVVTSYSYAFAGAAPDAENHLYAGDSLRKGSLAPSTDPIDAVEELTWSPRWEALLNATDQHHPKPSREAAQRLLWLVRREALHAIDHLYTPPEREDPVDCCKDPSEVWWRRVVDDVRALGIRWDGERQDFVRSR